MGIDWHMVLEAFGYFSSILIVFSLTRTSVKKLWIINAIGAICYIIYAVLAGSYPGALMNLGALVIDIVQLYRLYHVHSSFETVETSAQSHYFQWFVDRHSEDIQDYDPEERYKTAQHLLYYVRDNEVAGLLAYNDIEDGRIEIVLDYVTEKFRDCRIGRYFFGDTNPFFRSLGITEFTTRTKNPKHEQYLKQLNLTSTSDGMWSKTLRHNLVAQI